MWDGLVKCCIYLLKERNRTNSFVTAVKRASTSKKSRRNFANHPHWSHLLFGRLTRKAPLLWHYGRDVEAISSRCESFRLCKGLFCGDDIRFVGGCGTDQWHAREDEGSRGGAAPHSISAGLRFSFFPPRANNVLAIINRYGTRTHESLVPT